MKTIITTECIIDRTTIITLEREDRDISLGWGEKD
jgi:hypothetical protein